jgi:hypothetical protein
MTALTPDYDADPERSHHLHWPVWKLSMPHG